VPGQARHGEGWPGGARPGFFLQFRWHEYVGLFLAWRGWAVRGLPKTGWAGQGRVLFIAHYQLIADTEHRSVAGHGKAELAGAGEAR